MNTIDLTNKVDFPLSTSALKFLQDAYSQLENLGLNAGDAYIISGCVDAAGIVSAGIMFLDGKLMPFLGGALDTTVKIVQTNTSVVVDGYTRNQITYQAEFGTVATHGWQFNWGDIKDNRNLLNRDVLTTSLDLPNFFVRYSRYSSNGKAATLNCHLHFFLNVGQITDPTIDFAISVPLRILGTHFALMVDGEVVRATITQTSPLKIQLNTSFLYKDDYDIYIATSLVL